MSSIVYKPSSSLIGACAYPPLDLRNLTYSPHPPIAAVNRGILPSGGTSRGNPRSYSALGKRPCPFSIDLITTIRGFTCRLVFPAQRHTNTSENRPGAGRIPVPYRLLNLNLNIPNLNDNCMSYVEHIRKSVCEHFFYRRRGRRAIGDGCPSRPRCIPPPPIVGGKRESLLPLRATPFL